jgi:arginine exporter protein ArgO
MGEALWAGVVAGFAVALPLGAIGMLLLQLGAADGWRAGAAGAAGVATADLLWAGVAAAAGGAVAAFLRPYLGPLRIVAAVALLAVAAYGIRRALRPRSPSAARAVPHGRRWATFLGLTVLNPTTVGTFAAIVVALPPGLLTGVAERIVFVLGVGTASLLWQLLLVAGGAAAGARLPARAQLWTAIAGNVAVAGLAVAALLA